MKFLRNVLFSLILLFIFSNEIWAACESVYIVNQNNNTISVIDPATNSTTAVIPNTMGLLPREIAFIPDRTRAYVSNQGNDSVSVIDVASNTVIDNIALAGGVVAVGMAASSTHVYVVGNGSSMVHVIDIATNAVVDIPVPSGSLNDVAITQDGTQLYITSGSGVVEIMEIPSNILLAMPAIVGGNPQGVAMTAEFAYVCNQGTSDVSKITIADPTIVTTSAAVFTTAQDIAISPDGTTAYITSASGGTDLLFVYDIATDALSATFMLPMGSDPSYQVSVSPDGTKVYVTNNAGNTLSIVDVAANSISTTALSPALDGPFGIGFLCTISGSCKKDIFLTQIDLINQISWFPILSSVPVEYQIFRNGVLIGTVPSTGPLTFQDPGRRKQSTDVYSVYAMTSNNFSLIGVITGNPCR